MSKLQNTLLLSVTEMECYKITNMHGFRFQELQLQWMRCKSRWYEDLTFSTRDFKSHTHFPPLTGVIDPPAPLTSLAWVYDTEFCWSYPAVAVPFQITLSPICSLSHIFSCSLYRLCWLTIYRSWSFCVVGVGWNQVQLKNIDSFSFSQWIFLTKNKVVELCYILTHLEHISN
jgi:hypothetical protein